MDLKDVIKTVREKAEEASRAYHAGHKDIAENYLGELRTVIQAYFGELEQYAGNVTESATSETPAETSQETPAAAAGAVLPATQFAPPADAQKKALDQAGP